MTDEQWLNAIAKYNAEETEWRGKDFVGGAHELAQQLQLRTQQEPNRFAKLLLQFPVNTHLYYFEAVLRGLGETSIDVETTLNVCRYCHALPDKPCGRFIHSPIIKLAEQELPEEALDIVAWYATNDADPLGQEDAEYKQYNGWDLENAGLNSVRGGAAFAIADLIYADKERVNFFAPTLEKLACDKSNAVRTFVAEALRATLNKDRDFAVNLFLRLVNTDDELLGTRFVDHFLYSALYTHFEQLKPLLQRMLSSDNQKATRNGALCVCVIALRLEEALPLAQLCITGTQPHRKAAAEIFAQNIATAINQTFCEGSLISLFNDKIEEIREIASACFRNLQGNGLGDFTRLVEAFVFSPSFKENALSLIYALDKTTAKLPDITCFICERLMDVTGADDEDIQKRAAKVASGVSKIVVRTYTQSKDLDIQSRCLKLIDLMAQQHVLGLNEALSELDR